MKEVIKAKLLILTATVALFAMVAVTSNSLWANMTIEGNNVIYKVRNSTEGFNFTFPKEIQYELDFAHLIYFLKILPKGSVINLYLAGVGGRIDITKDIIYAIRHTKAHVIIHVTGDVSSAHAFIAVAGHKLKVNKYASFLYHTSSLKGYKKIYDKRYLRYILLGKGSIFKRIIEYILDNGTDRGISKDIKIKNYIRAHLADAQDLIKSFNILTEEEIKLVEEGHDIHIEAEEIKRRFDKKRVK